MEKEKSARNELLPSFTQEILTGEPLLLRVVNTLRENERDILAVVSGSFPTTINTSYEILVAPRIRDLRPEELDKFIAKLTPDSPALVDKKILHSKGRGNVTYYDEERNLRISVGFYASKESFDREIEIEQSKR